MESLFLLAFAEEEFLAALGMTGSETFFNKLLGSSRTERGFDQGVNRVVDLVCHAPFEFCALLYRYFLKSNAPST